MYDLAHLPPLPGMILARPMRRLAPAAAAALTYFTDQLKLAAEPDLYWFFEVRPAGGTPGYSTSVTMLGCAVPEDNEVWLNLNISQEGERQLWTVMAHEMAHIAGMNEDQAQEYERQAHVAESYYCWRATQVGAA